MDSIASIIDRRKIEILKESINKPKMVRLKVYENEVHVRNRTKTLTFSTGRRATSKAGAEPVENSETLDITNSKAENTLKTHHHTALKMRDYIMTNYSYFNSFVTLTFRTHITSYDDAYPFFKDWIDYQKKKGIINYYIGTWELTKKGRVHFHLLTDFIPPYPRYTIGWRHGFVLSKLLNGIQFGDSKAPSSFKKQQKEVNNLPQKEKHIFQSKIDVGVVGGNSNFHCLRSSHSSYTPDSPLLPVLRQGLGANSKAGQDPTRLARYMTKYLTKGIDELDRKNVRKLIKSNNLRKPDISIMRESDFEKLDLKFKSCYYDFANQNNVNIFTKE